MAFELQGKLIEIFNVVQVSHSFRKREFVVAKEENANGRTFTEAIKFQLTQDRCGLLDSFAKHDFVKVTFNIKGKRWEKDGNVSYFTNLEAWKIEKAGSAKSKDIQVSGEDFIPDREPTYDVPF